MLETVPFSALDYLNGCQNAINFGPWADGLLVLRAITVLGLMEEDHNNKG